MVSENEVRPATAVLDDEKLAVLQGLADRWGIVTPVNDAGTIFLIKQWLPGLLGRIAAERQARGAAENALRPFADQDASAWADVSVGDYPVDITVTVAQWREARRVLGLEDKGNG